jgi:hypothetical protein
MKRDSVRQIVVALATVATIVINVLANALPINGQTTAEISDRIQVYFTPAGYVFAIWGLIYLGLIVFTIYQALPAQRANPALRRVGWPYVVSCLANSAWIFLWHYDQIAWSLVAMGVLLVALIAIYLLLGIGLGKGPSKERWPVRAPFSVYLGWITVATVANVAAYLWTIGWGGWGLRPEVWTAIMIAVAAILGVLVLATRRDPLYALVLVWALAGIVQKHPEILVISLTAGAAAVGLFLGAVVALWRKLTV